MLPIAFQKNRNPYLGLQNLHDLITISLISSQATIPSFTKLLPNRLTFISFNTLTSFPFQIPCTCCSLYQNYFFCWATSHFLNSLKYYCLKNNISSQSLVGLLFFFLCDLLFFFIAFVKFVIIHLFRGLFSIYLSAYSLNTFIYYNFLYD